MVDLAYQNLARQSPVRDGRAAFVEIFRWVVIVTLLVSVALGYAWLRFQTLEVQYQIEQLRKENEKLKEINSALRAEQSSLIDPERIDQKARQMGLISNTDPRIRVLQAIVPRAAEQLLAHSRVGREKLRE